MRKSTALIVVITFVLSVVIVGVFGMRMMSYNTRIYVKEITPTEVVTSSEAGGVLKKGEAEREWNVFVPYSSDLTVRIDYAISPADATNPKVELRITSSGTANYAELDGLNIHVNKECTVRLNYRATDGSGAEMTIYLYVLSPELFAQMFG